MIDQCRNKFIFTKKLQYDIAPRTLQFQISNAKYQINTKYFNT